MFHNLCMVGFQIDHTDLKRGTTIFRHHAYWNILGLFWRTYCMCRLRTNARRIPRYNVRVQLCPQACQRVGRNVDGLPPLRGWRECNGGHAVLGKRSNVRRPVLEIDRGSRGVAHRQKRLIRDNGTSRTTRYSEVGYVYMKYHYPLDNSASMVGTLLQQSWVPLPTK